MSSDADGPASVSSQSAEAAKPHRPPPGSRMKTILSRSVLSGLVTAGVVSCGLGPDSTGPSSRRLSRCIETADITFCMAEGDSVNAAYMQAFHEWAVPYLGITMPQRLRYYKYLDNAHMRELTGQPWDSWADVLGYAVHSVERQQGHEAVHVYSFAIGWPTDFFAEGIAVALNLNPYTGAEVPFIGAPVHALCRGWLADGSLYPLQDIVANDGFGGRRWERTYAQAGSFTQFLIAEFGLDRLKSLFGAVDDFDSTDAILAAFEAVYGIPLGEAEARWHALLRGS